MKESEGQIIVAGHTDNVPITSARFRSNWDLSAARATALSVADYDSDGDLDLFVGCYGAPNLLLANDGSGNFVDVATEVGLERFPYLSLTSAWADLDLDGDLDLLVGNYAEIPPRPEASREPSRLYLGDGGSQFEDVSDWLPARVQDAYTFMNPFIDINGDGYPEIVSITDFFYLEPSAILVNEIGIGFTVDEFSGFQLGFNGMGIGIGDANDDGLPDFVQSSTGRLSLMLSTPMPDNPSGGLWIEYAGARGLAPDRDEGHTFGWGAEYVDIDNDGDLDLFVCNYVRWSRAIDFEVNYTLVGVGRAYGPPTNFEASVA